MPFSRLVFSIIFFAFVFTAPLVSQGDEAQPPVIIPTSPTAFMITQNGGGYISVDLSGIWGPHWTWAPFQGKMTADGDTTHFAYISKTGVSLTGTAHLEDGKNLVIETNLSAARDTEITKAILTLTLGADRFVGTPVATDAQGQTHNVPIWTNSEGGLKNIASIALTGHDDQHVGIQLDPPASLSWSNALRIELAPDGKVLAATPLVQKTTITLPWNVTYYPSQDAVPGPDMSQWFPFTPNLNENGEDELSMQDWLPAPAGQYGRILAKGDQLIYNGKPMKFWGINDCYGSCAPPKAMAEKEAAFYARNGINAIRFHKFAEGMGKPPGGGFVTISPADLDRMDYFVAQLKAKGIYVELSPVFYVTLFPADHDAVPYWNEFTTGYGNSRFTDIGSIYLSKEFQEMRIAQTTSILKHFNPYTNMTYAEDPDIFLVELQNEDSALFGGPYTEIMKTPTLRKRAGELFTAWLKKKYGTQDKLMAAWGPGMLNAGWLQVATGESWDANSILPAGNPWFYDPDQLDGADGKTPSKFKPRLLDTMQFLYELQNDYYDRFTQAIRDTGYTGMVINSNWIAGRAYSQFYNLSSDARAGGPIDRHIYFGGMGSVLAKPASGELSVGLQQVADRPFMVSEWIHVAPNEYGVEGPAVIGAYGLGLQGWSGSFIFQASDQAKFNPTIYSGNWEVFAPQVAGIFPAVARQVLRGDVTTSTVTSVRNVSLGELNQGKLGFDDRSSGTGDIKTFGGKTVPAEALTAVRCLVAYNDAEKPTQPFDVTPYLQGDAVKSSTGELLWQPGAMPQSGWITINTNGTKAAVGFDEGQKIVLGDVSIAPQSRFSAIYLTAKDPDGTLDKSNTLILSAIARARNTGEKILQDNFYLQKGTAPILMEPVKATITLTRPGVPTVTVLDTAGRMTSQTIPVDNGTFTIDTGRDKSCYYLVTY